MRYEKTHTCLKHFMVIIFLMTPSFGVIAQIVSNITAELISGKVAVHYNLQSAEPVNCTLSYSVDGFSFVPCRTVSGDLVSQTTGNKTILWSYPADNIRNGSFYFKVEALKATQPATAVTTPNTVTPKITPAPANDLNIEMVFVEGGTFDINKDYRVTLSSYYIGKYEVTQAQWKAVMGNNSSKFSGDNLPVENVNWYDVQEFIKKLNATTGKNYRLPTEAEWIFASRGGNQSKGYKYSGSNNINEVAWYEKNSNKKSHTVGTRLPNELGIYDMSGNVSEWCSDWFYYKYSKGEQINPVGPVKGSWRVYRGGNWKRDGQYAAKIGYADYFSPTNGAPPINSRYNDLIGFRLACDAE